jgi:hypothetical protein
MHRIPNRLSRWAPLALAATLAVCAPRAVAEDVPTPAEVLAAAGSSRSELIRTLSEVERFAPSLPAAEDLYPYIELLDELEALRIRFELDTFGANPVRHMAQVVTREALKWVRFDRETPEFLDVYLRWAPDDTRQSAVSTQSYYLAEATEAAGLLHWNEVAGRAIEVLQNERAQPYVITSYQDLQGIVIGRLLRLQELDEATALTVISSCHSTQGLFEIVQVLEQQAYAETDGDVLRSTIARGLAAQAAVKALTTPTPSYLATAPSQVLLEALQKLLFAGDAADVATAPALVAAFPGRLAVDLGGMLTQLAVVGFKPSQVEFLWVLSRSLVSQYEAMGLRRELVELQKVIGKLQLLRLAGSHGYEGTYRVRVGGSEGILTLANTSATTFVAGLGLPMQAGSGGMYIDRSFMSVVYDARRDEFVATRYALTMPGDQGEGGDGGNDVLTFTIANGTVSGRALLDGGFRSLSGTLVDPYARYDAEPASAPEALSGTYVGHGDSGRQIRLDIVQTGPQATGNMVYDGGMATVRFVNGYANTGNNAVYLTTREQDNGRWLQIRGQIRDGDFVGQYILGGQGRKFGTIRLRKVTR